MSGFKTERECAQHLGDSLEGLGFKVLYEVPFYSGNADLVAIRADTILAVEVKLRDHRRGLSQALKHLLFADRVYVALPTDRAMGITWPKEKAFGVGLIAVGPGAEILVESDPDVPPSQQQRGRVLAACRERWRRQLCLT